jgi:SAM-dependent methyltransferase
MTDLIGDEHPTRRFSNRVEHYAKYRPGYPPELISLLSREVGLTSSSVLADVGSGTGILSEVFLRNGNIVYGVEPNEEMRAAAERLLAGRQNFHSIAGTAEDTTLSAGSVDGILAAQAFHWFDHEKAAREFRQVARPGGFVALIWNARTSSASPFMAEYERIVREFGTEFARGGRELVADSILQSIFGEGLRKSLLPNHQDLDWEGLRGRLLSASYMPTEGRPGYEPMMRALRQTFDANRSGGIVRMEYETRVYSGRVN